MLLTKDSIYAAITPNVFITPSYTQKGKYISFKQIYFEQIYRVWEGPSQYDISL